MGVTRPHYPRPTNNRILNNRAHLPANNIQRQQRSNLISPGQLLRPRQPQTIGLLNPSSVTDRLRSNPTSRIMSNSRRANLSNRMILPHSILRVNRPRVIHSRQPRSNFQSILNPPPSLAQALEDFGKNLPNSSDLMNNDNPLNLHIL